MRGAKGYKILPYTPYGLKLGVEFNRIGYESGDDFVLFLIQDLELNIVLLLLFFNLLRKVFRSEIRQGKSHCLVRNRPPSPPPPRPWRGKRTSPILSITCWETAAYWSNHTRVNRNYYWSARRKWNSTCGVGLAYERDGKRDVIFGLKYRF